jgi:DNA/RNA-binding domain of Phe-tRNA-synthetase-like protein
VFTPLGQPGTTETPLPDEVIYRDEARVLTRCWNHRDADQTKVTEDSSQVVFLLERVSDVVSEDVLSAARGHLVRLLRPHVASIATGQVSLEEPIALLIPIGADAS